MSTTPERILGVWLRASWFWAVHSALSTIIATLLPWPGAIVCLVAAGLSALTAVYGRRLADGWLP